VRFHSKIKPALYGREKKRKPKRTAKWMQGCNTNHQESISRTIISNDSERAALLPRGHKRKAMKGYPKPRKTKLDHRREGLVRPRQPDSVFIPRGQRSTEGFTIERRGRGPESLRSCHRTIEKKAEGRSRNTVLQGRNDVLDSSSCVGEERGVKCHFRKNQ